jgi:hypothetical protein
MKIIKRIFPVLLIVFVSYHSFAQDDVYYSRNNKEKIELTNLSKSNKFN